MFTKYSGITPPQNYSGNRFKSHPNDTEMKTHKGTELSIKQTPPKASAFPAFQESVDRIAAESDQGLVQNNFEVAADRKQEELYEENPQIIDTPPEKAERTAQNALGDFLNQSGVGKLLKNLRSDDILLISLILFLAEEGNKNSNDAILILALLLLYR